MKSSFFLGLTILVCACTSRSAAMTRVEYDEVLLGSPIGDVTACYGEPYSVRACDGAEEYQYIEKLIMNDQLAYENHYFIRVVNGQVVSKRMKQQNRPAYDLMYQADPNYPQYPQY